LQARWTVNHLTIFLTQENTSSSRANLVLLLMFLVDKLMMVLK